MARIPLLAVAAALTLAACTTPSRPDPGPWASGPTDSAVCAGFAAGRGAPPRQDWWLAYGDPQLDALVALAVANPPTLTVAGARLRAAAALAGGSGLPPDIAAALDLWRRNRSGLVAATSHAEAARLERVEACLLLTTGLVGAYGEYWRHVADRDAAPAAAALAASEDEMAARRALVALVGVDPANLPVLQTPTAGRARFEPPADLVGQLLGRRPDLQAARRRLLVADRRLEAARADAASPFAASRSLRFRAVGLNNLIRSGSDIGQAALGFWPQDIDAATRIGAARAERAAGAAAYDRALADALKEVDLALAEERAVDRQLGEALAGRDASRGADGDAAQRLDLARLRARGLAADAALIRALGGAFGPPP